VDKLSSAVKEHYEKVAEIDRLRMHQGEHPTTCRASRGRFRRSALLQDYNIDAHHHAGHGRRDRQREYGRKKGRALRSSPTVSWKGDAGVPPMPSVTVKKKKLVEAHLDTVLAYKGNYMVFALKDTTTSRCT
jgi:hypothetical protein